LGQADRATVEVIYVGIETFGEIIFPHQPALPDFYITMLSLRKLVRGSDAVHAVAVNTGGHIHVAFKSAAPWTLDL
jgi:hypothetical protein